jgi:light-regulated signal transduction histidine kinase (bacteriophytochrome)
MLLPTEQTAASSIDQEGLVYRLIHRIRQSLDLSDILNVTAAEVQAFVGMDRIKIYQFQADGCGQVIAEYLAPNQPLPSLFGLHFPADDIPTEARQLYIESRVRTVVDVASRQIGQSRLLDPQTGKRIDEPIHYRALDPCHAEYLTTMAVKSSFGAPILHNDQLWGLLIGHHSESREISAEQLHGIQLVVEQLSLAIGHTALLEDMREKAHYAASTNQVNDLLHHQSMTNLQSALAATVKALGGVGGRLFIQENAFDSPAIVAPTPVAPTPLPLDCLGGLYTWGRQPIMPEHAHPQEMEQCHAWQQHFNRAGYQPWTDSEFEPTSCQPWAIANIDQVSDLRTLQSACHANQIRSLLIVPLQARQQVIGYLSIFRTQVDIETLWAGEFDPDQRQTLPRQSFAIWRQMKQDQPQPWTANEIEWANTIGQYFAAAIEKDILHQQIQTFNNNLERQVEERTTALNQALSDLQKTQFHLIQAEKMSSLGQLVAGIAHEINNPVNFIHGNLIHIHHYFDDLLNLMHLYQGKPLPEAEINQLLETIDLEFVAEDLPKTLSSMRFGTERIREIVQSLRTFSRLDQAELKYVDLHDGIDSTLMILQHRLKATATRAEIKIIKDYGNLPEVECYAGLLNQAIMNLVSNAIEAIEAQPEPTNQRLPEILIETELMHIQEESALKDVIRISVTDNGQGMAEATRQKVFDPFFTTKPVGKGTGLGLSLSYQIITDNHHGTLTCDSVVNQGSTFQITIPLIQPSTN